MTERLARISARRPWTTIALWLVLAVVALAIVDRLLPTALTTELGFISTFSEVESWTAKDMLEEAQLAPPLSEAVMVQSETLTVDDPAFRAKVEELTGALIAIGPDVVAGGFNYYLTNDERLVSADQKTTIISLQLVGSIAEATQNAEQIIHVVDEADRQDGFRVLVAGDATIAFENGELSESDLTEGERIGVPMALLILLVLFGAVVAALVPIGIAAVSIVITLAIVALIGNIFGELVFFVQLWITMIGLAVGIDYSLIAVSRFREEMAKGLSARDAVARTGATANRTVLFSGMTVVIALVGILIIPHTLFFSTALGAILVVIVSVVAALTLLPAVLALLGPRVDRLRLPFIRKDSGGGGEEKQRHGFWEFITYRTMRFPVISVVVVAGLMLWASYYYFDINRGFNSVEVFPEDSHTRAGFEVLEEKFSFGYVNPAKIVIDGDLNDPQVWIGITTLISAIRTDPELGTYVLQTSPSEDLGLILVPVPGAPSGRAAFGAVERLRDDYVPASFDGVPATVLAGDLPASFDGVPATVLVGGFAIGGIPGLQWGGGHVHAHFIRVDSGRQFHPASDRLPVDRHPCQGHHHEPSLRRYRLRADGGRFPEGHWSGPVWISTDRDHRCLDTPGALRGSLRAVDGLPRLYAEPHQGEIRPNAEQRRVRGLRAPFDGRPDHWSCPHHGRRVQRFRLGRYGRKSASRVWACRGRVARRDPGARHTRTGQHAVAGQSKLVHAVLA